MKYEETFRRVKAASQRLALVHDKTKNRILCDIADAILERKGELLAANAEDLWYKDRRDPLYDRLLLTEQRLAAIARDMRRVAELPSPLGGVIEARTLPNGLRLRRVGVPFGVVGVIYEARPNVSFDVFSLCFKAGNACVLKGGSDAARSNEAIVRLIHSVLDRWPECGPWVVELLPPTHDAAEAMLRRIVKGNGLYRINNVVDINNLISVSSGYSIGAYDMAQLEEFVQLRCAEDGCHYDGIGKSSVNIGHLPVLAVGRHPGLQRQAALPWAEL